MIKTITVDGFYSKETALELTNIIVPLSFKKMDIGQEILDFNVVPADIDESFSTATNKNMSVYKDSSGIFRRPANFIHFEGFDSSNDWMFAVALETSTFNIFEHNSGALDARTDHKLNYQNLFDWDLTVNYVLKPGQGIFFRPWIFHSFNDGLIQLFRMEEK